MTVVVLDQTGSVGAPLIKRLLALGHTVVAVATRAPSFTHERLYFINCDTRTAPLPFNVLERTDAVINLIPDLESTKRTVESIAASANRPTVFVCASEIAYYGSTPASVADEQFPQGGDARAELIGKYEEEARAAAQYGVRVVIVRAAPVLELIESELLRTAKLGFVLHPSKSGGALSWIAQDDLVNAYIFAIQTNTLQGTVNAVAPTNVSGRDLVETLARKKGKAILGTLPEGFAKRFFKHSHDYFTVPVAATPKRLIDKGFEFQYPDVDAAFTR